MIAAAAILVAVALDLACGEPPDRLHPVAWLGRLVGALRRRAPRHGAIAQLLWGALVALVVPALAAAVGHVVTLALARLPGVVAAIALGVALKPAFAIRALGGAAAVVADALARGDLARARTALRALCSRDARALGPEEVAAGAVESVAENLSDSVIAPLVAFALAGLPGAYAYRAINTLDAMLGYRGALEYLGKASARLDDLANWIPARVTAALLLVAGALRGADVRGGVRTWWRDADQTASPNAGHPMAVAAGLLGVTLTKRGHYQLGDGRGALDATTIHRAWSLAVVAAALGAVAAAALAGRLA